jgi:mannosyltransferase OCH1-like enzyme
MIPKRIYQTWTTKEVPYGIKQVIKRMMDMNPSYNHYLYDDKDMDTFIKDNYPKNVYKAYSMLGIGAAKADLWRYCILYKYGGVYLDIDAALIKPLDELIRDEDSAIITREHIEGLFCQWFMIFKKAHPLLKSVINECVDNILEKSSNNIMELTGTVVFTKIINDRIHSNQIKYINEEGYGGDLWHSYDKNLVIFNEPDRKYRCRFFGINMNEYANQHNEFYEQLYTDIPHWEIEQKTRSIYIYNDIYIK